MSTYYETDEVIEYWERRYEKWAVAPDEDVFRAKDEWFETRFAHILPPVQIGGEVLDFGCGNTMYSVPLLRRYSHYFGVDTSPMAIRLAHRYFGDTPNWHVYWLPTWSMKPPSPNWHAYWLPTWPMKLPFGDCVFDAVFTCTVLQHLPLDWRRFAIDELKRVLKPEGRYVGMEFIGPTAAFDMPPMNEGEWIESWKPLKIVKDLPPEHPEWHADNVWHTE